MFEAAIEAGAEDVERDGDEFVVTTEPTEFAAVREGLERAGVEATSAELTRVAKSPVPVSGKAAEKLAAAEQRVRYMDAFPAPAPVWASAAVAMRRAAVKTERKRMETPLRGPAAPFQLLNSVTAGLLARSFFPPSPSRPQGNSEGGLILKPGYFLSSSSRET